MILFNVTAYSMYVDVKFPPIFFCLAFYTTTTATTTPTKTTTALLPKLSTPFGIIVIAFQDKTMLLMVHKVLFIFNSTGLTRGHEEAGFITTQDGWIG